MHTLASGTGRASGFALAAVVFALAGCAAGMRDRYFHDRPIVNVTPSRHELERLPPPAEKILVSVWKIPDETGQNRPSTSATELSKAVTQGAHHMLIKALNDSGWFVVVDRERWPELIQEIRIKEELKKRGLNGVHEDFDRLSIPAYMVSGAITEFEDHPVSLGGGASFRGFFGSARVQMSSVGVDLRLTDANTGTVADAVSMFKRILSQQVDAGLFKFVSTHHLLELEFGYTLNEPTQLAVREAIERGVIQLVVRAVRHGLPQFAPAHPDDRRFFEEYRLEERNPAPAQTAGRSRRSGKSKSAAGRDPQGNLVLVDPALTDELYALPPPPPVTEGTAGGATEGR